MILQGPIMEELARSAMVDWRRELEEDVRWKQMQRASLRWAWRQRLGRLLVEKGMALQKA